MSALTNLIQKIKHVTGFEKVERLNTIIKHNNGILGSIKKLYLTDDLKVGTLVGEDQFGNKYYENPYYFVPRNRWVEFSEKLWLDYDASHVPPEWHRWLTNMTEYPPTIDKPVQHKWMLPYTPNMTGTSESYMPESTVKPKIETWAPKSKSNPRLAITGKS